MARLLLQEFSQYEGKTSWSSPRIMSSVSTSCNPMSPRVRSVPTPVRRQHNCVTPAHAVQCLVNMKLMPGTAEVAHHLDGEGVPRAIITRNVPDGVAHFHNNVFPHRPFDPALARTFTPYKPAPDALLHICKHWGIQASEVVMVGDSAKDDIVCGNRAGAQTILIDFEQKYKLDELPHEHRPTFHVFSMHEVLEVLREKCVLLPRSVEQQAVIA